MLTIDRHFTKDFTKDPYESTEWEERTAKITGAGGNIVFEQEKVKVPKAWSATATNIVANKYFYGKKGSSIRETGVDQLIKRVVNTITESGIKQGYFNADNAKVFNDELAFLLINQYGAFNSPVWFNVGCHLYEPECKSSHWHWDFNTNKVIKENSGYYNPQCAACFINSVDDSMESIMELATTEAMLFKGGSGSGTNFSSLRSNKENLSGGGTSSGPLSFMRGLDAFAGVIKSGGKTRRAAKMCILNVEHPDIVDFINCKLLEDKKAQALVREGYDGTSGPDSEAYYSVFYQNANNSVRVTDQFMYAVEKDLNFSTLMVKDGSEAETFKARDLQRKISTAAWSCGDPGLIFADNTEKWNTSKNSGEIHCTNPCGEFTFLDDTACNLASLNLIKFLKGSSFDTSDFNKAVRLFIITQDILVDMSGYPTEKIAKNSHDFRPLGLGYANLGALLMSLGLPYDSEEGRDYAAVITAIMTGEAYNTSAWLSYSLDSLYPTNEDYSQFYGSFPGYNYNKESFLEVIQSHRKDLLELIDKYTVLGTKLYVEASTSWGDAYNNGSKYGFRNAQVTVLAPTGTIGFMMDCDTTGIEPELALVKFKRLVGGGQLKIVNETVPEALRNLGYSDLDIKSIVNEIDINGSIEGSRIILDKDLPVFDTAFRPINGTRSIHYMGHIKMMAACQPFLSGAISKTVNLPNEATVEDIEEAYMQAWKLGLKSIAVYRDGSKSNQVLVTSNKKEIKTPSNSISIRYAEETKETIEQLKHKVDIEQLIEAIEEVYGIDISESLSLEVSLEQDLEAPPVSTRHKLPDTRNAINHKFSIVGHEGYLNVGLYGNGQPGEIFITMAKEGSTMSGLMDSFALVFSISLQHGVPLESLVSKLEHTRFEPSGWTSNPDMGYAKSIMDYIARWLRKKFLEPQQLPLIIESREDNLLGTNKSLSIDKMDYLEAMITDDTPTCTECGALMVRSGTCHTCTACGTTGGCS